MALKGFALLFRKFGYLEVQENMFHITKSKKAKVWLSKDISQLRPAVKLTSATEVAEQMEARMIRNIVKIVWDNTYQV